MELPQDLKDFKATSLIEDAFQLIPPDVAGAIVIAGLFIAALVCR